MNGNLDWYLDKPVDFLQLLNESDKRLFYFTLDYITNSIFRGNGLPPVKILSKLTKKTHIIAYVMKFIQAQNEDTLRDSVATLQSWKPLFVDAPPTQAKDSLAPAASAAKKSDSPLHGTALLDGQSSTWEHRLAEKSSTYYAGTGPLIRDYHEARQVRAEYGSLEFKEVAAQRSTDFPASVDAQQKLVAELYDAIMNMDDILEKKRPILIKKNGTGPAAPKRKRSDNNNNDNNKKTNKVAEDGGADAAGDSDNSKENSPSVEQHPELKETISVVKVKSLSRIEVEMLCWEILYTVRDVDQGRLPFLAWSGRDWGWDAQFPSFRDRLAAVAETLRRSKAAVCSLLESDYLARLAAHPRREYRRKENNRSQNAERNAQVFVGRHAIGTGQVRVVAATGDLQDRDGNVVAAASADHSGLIEQTRKLGEMGQHRMGRETKRAKTALAEADGNSNAATAAGGRAASAPADSAHNNNNNNTATAVSGATSRRSRARQQKATAKTATVATGTKTTETTSSPKQPQASGADSVPANRSFPIPTTPPLAGAQDYGSFPSSAGSIPAAAAMPLTPPTNSSKSTPALKATQQLPLRNGTAPVTDSSWLGFGDDFRMCVNSKMAAAPHNAGTAAVSCDQDGPSFKAPSVGPLGNNINGDNNIDDNRKITEAGGQGTGSLQAGSCNPMLASAVSSTDVDMEDICGSDFLIGAGLVESKSSLLQNQPDYGMLVNAPCWDQFFLQSGGFESLPPSRFVTPDLLNSGNTLLTDAAAATAQQAACQQSTTGNKEASMAEQQKELQQLEQLLGEAGSGLGQDASLWPLNFDGTLADGSVDDFESAMSGFVWDETTAELPGDKTGSDKMKI